MSVQRCKDRRNRLEYKSFFPFLTGLLLFLSSDVVSYENFPYLCASILLEKQFIII